MGGGIGESSSYGVMKQIQVQQANLTVASVNTGGRAFVNQSDLTGAVNAIVRENGSFYVLGYYPSPAQRDGRFHPIEVRVTRPGARVRARAGYTATAATATDGGPAENLAAAMAAGVDSRGLTLRAQVTPLLPLDKGMRSAVTIQVTYPTIESELPFDEVKVQILALDADGKVRASSNRGYSFTPPKTQRTSATFLINDAIDLPGQALTMRIGVSSRALGRTGTVQLPLFVPKPSDSQLQMGSLVIGLDGPPRESALGDALVRGIIPFQPSTTREFGTRTTLRVFVPMFWRGRDPLVKATLTLRDDVMELQRDETLAAQSRGGNARLTALDTLIPLAKLSGAVTLQVEGRLPNGQTAQQSVTFRVRPR
jgi:hypothetical protein